MGIRLRPHDRHCRQTLEDAVEVRPPPGHKWAAVIGNRTGGNKSGCPVCADAGSIPGDLVWLYLMRHPDVPSCNQIFAKCSHFVPKRARNVKPPLRF